MAGCEVSPTEKLAFSIRHMNRQYLVHCGNESDHAEWMAALILSANANLPLRNEGDEQAVNGGTPIKRSASMGADRVKDCRSASAAKTSLHTLRLPSQHTHL
uniref:PH domain-containing protein n=1 Tax=Ditylenchus dipsaci TaxID=166011 RepID=A0A915DGR7_9BILA